jgi:hypothetical protein
VEKGANLVKSAFEIYKFVIMISLSRTFTSRTLLFLCHGSATKTEQTFGITLLDTKCSIGLKEHIISSEGARYV